MPVYQWGRLRHTKIINMLFHSSEQNGMQSLAHLPYLRVTIEEIKEKWGHRDRLQCQTCRNNPNRHLYCRIPIISFKQSIYYLLKCEKIIRRRKGSEITPNSWLSNYTQISADRRIPNHNDLSEKLHGIHVTPRIWDSGPSPKMIAWGQTQ